MKKSFLKLLFMAAFPLLLIAQDKPFGAAQDKPPEPPALSTEQKADAVIKKFSGKDATPEKFQEYFKEFSNVIAAKDVPDEQLKSLKSKLIETLSQKRTELAEAVKKSAGSNQNSALKKKKEELNKLRAETLKMINNEQFYPPKPNPLAEQNQKLIEDKTAKIREIWTSASKNLSALPQAAQKNMDLIEAINGIFSQLSADVPAENENLMKEIALDKKESDLAAHNKKAWQSNAKIKTSMTDQEKHIVQLTNEYREMMGLRVLEMNELLYTSAKKHADYMDINKYCGHEENIPGRENALKRAMLEKYAGTLVGENAAMHMLDADGIFNGWYNSPSHHRELVLEPYTQMGVGKTNMSWVINFGNGAVSFAKK